MIDWLMFNDNKVVFQLQSLGEHLYNEESIRSKKKKKGALGRSISSCDCHKYTVW